MRLVKVIDIDIDEILDTIIENGTYEETVYILKDLIKELREEDFYNILIENADLYSLMEDLRYKSPKMFDELYEYMGELKDERKTDSSEEQETKPN